MAHSVKITDESQPQTRSRSENTSEHPHKVQPIKKFKICLRSTGIDYYQPENQYTALNNPKMQQAAKHHMYAPTAATVKRVSNKYTVYCCLAHKSLFFFFT